MLGPVSASAEPRQPNPSDIPTRPRARVLDNPRKMQFLDAYSECGNIKRSASSVGINRDTHYEWLQADPAYAAEFAHEHPERLATVKGRGSPSRLGEC